MQQSSGKVKTGQLWSKNKADLASQLTSLKTELGQLRTQKIAGGSASKASRMYVYTRFHATPGGTREWRTLEIKEEHKANGGLSVAPMSASRSPEF